MILSSIKTLFQARIALTPMITSSFSTSPFSFSSSSSIDPSPQKATVEMRDGFLRLRMNASLYDFHFFWLYHNCSSWLHPVTRERVVDVPDIPLDIKPRRVDIFGDTLHIVWPAQRTSEFPLSWLESHAYARNRTEVPPPASDVRLLELHYPQLSPAEYSAGLLERIQRYGAAVVRGRGTDTEAIIQELLPEGHDVWASHFGRIEDLRTDNTTNQNTDQLGYTNIGIAPHTDMPFMQSPPSMQLLHGMQAAEKGGESYLVDARGAALYLRAKNPWAFDMLSTINIKFHRKQKNFEAVTHFPLIQTLGNHITQIRYSYFTMVCF